MNTALSRSVLIIGGSRGIGAALVKRFTSAGDRVHFTYAHSADAANALAATTGSTALQADSADRRSIERAIAEAAERSGPLDVLIVNAGVLLSGDPLTLDPEAVDHLFTVNIHAPYHAAIAAARVMSNAGRIIFIGSTNADRTPMSGLAAYGTSKAALQGMAKGLARDFGPREITVNVIQPGPTDTEMNPADGPLHQAMHSFMAIKRHAHADEIAAMAAWIAGPEAGIVTGAALTIDGGFAA